MDQTEEIKSKISIVDYISESVSLKKAGRNFKGLCPFHSEKTPSFIVSPERQIWRCFGCDKGGDIFSYVMEMERLEFPEALRILAEKAGVQLETRVFQSREGKKRRQLFAINHLASEFYHYLLTKHKIGEFARKYLKERGIKDKSIKTFFLGYAPEGWENLYKFLRKKGYTASDLELAGLVIKGRRGFYDRFRARIIFPLKNHRSDVVGFAGRVLDPEKKIAKYVNTPETLIYKKREILYGFDIAKESIRKRGRAVIVEGEFDVISSFQAGVSEAVAIKGSALTEAQTLLLKRFTDNIILALDQDTAGDAAARRGIEIADRAGMSIHVVQIPKGKDPDEAVRESALLWKKSVKDAVPFYDFLINSSFSRHNAKSAYGKKNITDELFPVLSKIENSIVQAHYVKLISEKLGVREDRIIDILRKSSVAGKFRKEEKIEKNQSAKDGREEYILSLVIQSRKSPLILANLCEQVKLDDFTHIPVKKILMLLSKYFTIHKEFDAKKFASTLPKELVASFDNAYLYDLGEVVINSSLFEREFSRVLYEFKRGNIQRKIGKISTKLKDNKNNSDDQVLALLNKRFKQLTSQLKELSKS